MQRYLLSKRLPLPLLLATLVLLLAVQLRGDDAPSDCVLIYEGIKACDQSCAMMTTKCGLLCHEAGTGCPASERKLTVTTHQGIKIVAAGTGQKLVSTTEHQCMEEWECTQTEYELTQCTYSGSGISYCDIGTPAGSSCYHCERGAPMPNCIVYLKDLDQCVFGG